MGCANSITQQVAGNAGEKKAFGRKTISRTHSLRDLTIGMGKLHASLNSILVPSKCFVWRRTAPKDSEELVEDLAMWYSGMHPALRVLPPKVARQVAHHTWVNKRTSRVVDQCTLPGSDASGLIENFGAMQKGIVKQMERIDHLALCGVRITEVKRKAPAESCEFERGDDSMPVPIVLKCALCFPPSSDWFGMDLGRLGKKKGECARPDKQDNFYPASVSKVLRIKVEGFIHEVCSDSELEIKMTSMAVAPNKKHGGDVLADLWLDKEHIVDHLEHLANTKLKAALAPHASER